MAKVKTKVKVKVMLFVFLVWVCLLQWTERKIKNRCNVETLHYTTLHYTTLQYLSASIMWIELSTGTVLSLVIISVYLLMTVSSYLSEAHKRKAKTYETGKGISSHKRTICNFMYTSTLLPVHTINWRINVSWSGEGRPLRLKWAVCSRKQSHHAHTTSRVDVIVITIVIVIVIVNGDTNVNRIKLESESESEFVSKI